MSAPAAIRTERLAALVAERARVLNGFVSSEQAGIALACHDMARAFARGGLLIAYGAGPAASDAAHVAVEFMHPVIVGKRALPALAPTSDATGESTVERLGRPDDIALAIAHRPGDEAVAEFLAAARRRGMLTVALGAEPLDADHSLVVAHDDPAIVQEVQETTYHVLWELVHVFFEHPGLLEDTCVTCGDVAVECRVVALSRSGAVVERDGTREEVAIDLVADVVPGDVLLCHAGVALEKPTPEDVTGFLYPFLAAEEVDLEVVLADIRASTLQKGADASALRRGIDLDAVAACAQALGVAMQAGGRLLAFGNGGSATDAQDVAADALRRGWPAIALANDSATITAVSNDVGFENVFARQLIALGRAGDVALAISTSGSSPNVIAALEEAHRRGMLTCAVTGYDGGRLAELEWLDHLLVVHGDYIPRLQEAQATVYHLLLEAAE